MNAEDFLNQGNLEYLELLYARYQQDPQQIDPATRSFFSQLESAPGQAWPRRDEVEPGEGAIDAATIRQLVDQYRNWGHLAASLDPLGLQTRTSPLLDLGRVGLSEKSLPLKVLGSPFRNGESSLEELIRDLTSMYAASVGIEYPPETRPRERAWLIEQVESSRRLSPTTGDQKWMLQTLLGAECFESFLQAKFVGQKRFSLEGGEALVVGLESALEAAALSGTDEFVMGMAHRGRLNVLANVIGKPRARMLAEFSGRGHLPDSGGDGDVKYHLGFSADRKTRSGKLIHCTLKPNPSHLELVNPVVEGATKAIQTALGDEGARQIMPILIHGEAAFVGQGVVAETLQLTRLPGFETGGTLHFVVNNQVGFTADSPQTRADLYPTSMAYALGAPVFHVNGDDPRAMAWASALAAAYRQRFRSDVFIDLWCYRKHGHNEADDPTFTQPVLYERIAGHPTPATVYGKKLVEEGLLSQEEVDRLRVEARAELDQAWSEAQSFSELREPEPPRGRWAGLSGGAAGVLSPSDARTRVDLAMLERVGHGLCLIPQGFQIHSKLTRFLASRAAMTSGSKPVDWSMAEAWAFGSLLLEGTPVRLVGQDSQRGTFTQRHAVWHDVKNGATYTALSHLAPDQAPFQIYNSMLSELAAVGFEYGYSSADPKTLVLWEGQFGDFANGAQPVIDQFLASGESKWQRMNGLVLLLPHGYEGQGAEHSSARLERYLQLCARNNLQVCYPSTPAQYFHVLRRQTRRPFRKPLVLMTPKSLLRHPLCVSRLADLIDEDFSRLLVCVSSSGTGALPESSVERILFCTGKVYYTLKEALAEAEADAGLRERLPKLASVRVEELYPFPEEEVAATVARFPAARDYCWIQEEPKNMGAWCFIEDRLRRLLPPGSAIRYVGRPEAASPAVGWFGRHEREEKTFLQEALSPLVASRASGLSRAVEVRSDSRPKGSKPENEVRAKKEAKENYGH